MGIKWTPAQAQAISYRGSQNALVAAAAGSGKTAVLVERIIQRILDEDDPLSVDRILVLTFTNAAAKEMKAKISAAISARLREFPDNKHLRAQMYRIQSADISTVHAFAQKIIKNNIHRTDIPADFRLADEAENKAILERALSDVLERYYAEFDRLPSFAELTMGYGGVRNDKSLREIILKLYDYSRSLAAPREWLRQSAAWYKAAAVTGTIDGTPWTDALLRAGRHEAREALYCYEEIERILDKYFPENHNVSVFYYAEAGRVRAVADSRTIDEYFTARAELVFKTRPSLKKFEKADELLLEAIGRINALRDMAKQTLSSPLAAYTSAEKAAETLGLMYHRVRTLVNIVLMLSRRHSRLKLQGGILDFSDLEHCLMGLITDSDGTPSALCEKLRSRYREIYVDEYQDTNNIQDAMFRLISGGQGNIFMVGDLKQSIYGFRNATPELFLKKYTDYGSGAGDGRLFVLSDNFRSRSTVIDAVNELFGAIMFRSAADIDYTERERLRCSADFPAAGDESIYKTEVIMTDVLTENTIGSHDENDKTELEAQTVARRIIRLTEDKLPVFDKALGRIRPIELGDIAVLFRGRNTLPVFERVFRDFGIPVLSENSGFLDSVEIGTVVSFLSIIDNPRQDIPLAAVMRCPIFAFTPDELAEIRVQDRRGCFYDALCAAADKFEKAREFLEKLNLLRDCSEYMGIHEIIYKICFDLDYMAIAGGMKGGGLRRANLALLLKIAADYEGSGAGGIFGFMEYLRGISSAGDLGQAKYTGGLSAVTMTTIHKSKGLEYPVVILADTSRAGGYPSTVLTDELCGIALDYVDTERKIRYPSFSMDLLKSLKKRAETAEEMRLLYVAMTRAREKLIISCTNAKVHNSDKWMKPLINSDGGVLRRSISATDCFRDWIVYGFLTNENAAGLRHIMKGDMSGLDICGKSGLSFELVHERDDKPEAAAAAEEETVPVQEPALSPSELKSILDYEYADEVLTHVPLKLSVSEIKRAAEQSMAEAEWEYTPRLSSIADRSFRSADGGAAETGTITHFALQHIDPIRTGERAMVAEQLSKMRAEGLLTDKQSEQLDTELIFRFFESDTGARVRAAAAAGRLLREFKMLFPVPAERIYPHLEGRSGGAEIIVQGVADCILIEDSTAVLIDYKTDSCTAEAAESHALKYKAQADYYSIGIEKILGLSVRERIIYFLKPGAAVSI